MIFYTLIIERLRCLNYSEELITFFLSPDTVHGNLSIQTYTQIKAILGSRKIAEVTNVGVDKRRIV